MKKFFSAVALSIFGFMSSGFNVGTQAISVADVNAKVAAITAPFNTPESKMHIAFTDLKTDAVRTLDFGMIFSLWRKGTNNELSFDVSKLNYSYGNGTRPTLDIQAAMRLDMVKALGQTAINDMAKDLDQALIEMAQEYTQKYGAAIHIDSKMDEIIRDSNGDVVQVSMHFTTNLDMTLLPVDLPADQVEFTQFDLRLSFSQTGANVMAQVVMNPQYYAFSPDQVGLKELVDALLNDDPDAFENLKGLAQFLDQIGQMLVEAHP